MEELKIALDNRDILEVADALTVNKFLQGHYPVDLNKCFEEVQNSNMSKLGMMENQFIMKQEK